MFFFKSKINRNSYESEEVDELLNFLLVSKKYFKITMKVMGTIRQSSRDKEKLLKKIKSEALFRGVSQDEKVEEFLIKIVSFYECDNDELAKRRGYFLEKITDKLGSIEDIDYSEKIFEAKVYDTKTKKLISENDLDIVLKGKEIEMQECKATLSNICKEPFKENNRRKLELMCKVKVGFSDNKVKTYAYLVTYSNNNDRCLDFLDSQNINIQELSVIGGLDIAEKLIKRLTIN